MIENPTFEVNQDVRKSTSDVGKSGGGCWIFGIAVWMFGIIVIAFGVELVSMGFDILGGGPAKLIPPHYTHQKPFDWTLPQHWFPGKQ